MLKRILSSTVIACFFLTTLGPIPKAHADSVLGLPAPGTMVNLSPAYEPVMIKGLTVHKDNPFLFDFIVDVGQDKTSGEPLKKEGEKLIRYFLASLAIPDKDLWVNLSPYEKNKMVPDALGQTDMGRDLLEQDYILKQITASLIYPEKQLGKSFWDKVYAKAQEMYGTTQIPVNTFNKVWIMADRAEVFEHNQTAFVVGSHLKVMLEEDYLALQKHVSLRGTSTASDAAISERTTDDTHGIASNIIRQIILPELEKEVNTGKNFANLRQIFNSIILSSWYKKNLKQALLNQVYANQSKIKGIDINDPAVKEQIYEQYLKAYKKGVFNYIKEDDVQGQTLPRKYFSGGMDPAMALNPTVTSDSAALAKSLPDRALVSFATRMKTQDSAMLTAPQNIVDEIKYVIGLINGGEVNTRALDKGAALGDFFAAGSSIDFIDELEKALTLSKGSLKDLQSRVSNMKLPQLVEYIRAHDAAMKADGAQTVIAAGSPESMVAVLSLYLTDANPETKQQILNLIDQIRASVPQRMLLTRDSSGNFGFRMEQFELNGKHMIEVLKTKGVEPAKRITIQKGFSGKFFDSIKDSWKVPIGGDGFHAYRELFIGGAHLRVDMRENLHYLDSKVIIKSDRLDFSFHLARTHRNERIIFLQDRDHGLKLEGSSHFVAIGAMGDLKKSVLIVVVVSDATFKNYPEIEGFSGATDDGKVGYMMLSQTQAERHYNELADAFDWSDQAMVSAKAGSPDMAMTIASFAHDFLSGRSLSTKLTFLSKPSFFALKDQMTGPYLDHINHYHSDPKLGVAGVSSLLGESPYRRLDDSQYILFLRTADPNKTYTIKTKTTWNMPEFDKEGLKYPGFIVQYDKNPVPQEMTRSQLTLSPGRPIYNVQIDVTLEKAIGLIFSSPYLKEAEQVRLIGIGLDVIESRNLADRYQDFINKSKEVLVRSLALNYLYSPAAALIIIYHKSLFEEKDVSRAKEILNENGSAPYKFMADIYDGEPDREKIKAEALKYLTGEKVSIEVKLEVLDALSRSPHHLFYFAEHFMMAQIQKKTTDGAMIGLGNIVKRQVVEPPGGIDLNTSNGMQWKVNKDGQGVEMTVDPAMIARVEREGIEWLSPEILKMTPVTSIWPLVGLQAPVQQEPLAQV